MSGSPILPGSASASSPTARRRVAVQDILDRVPAARPAYLEGRVDASKLLALRPVLNPENAPVWLALGTKLTVRRLAARTAETGSAPATAPDDLDEPNRGRIAFPAPQAVGFAFEHALETAQRVLGWDAPRDECLEAMLMESDSSLPWLAAPPEESEADPAAAAAPHDRKRKGSEREVTVGGLGPGRAAPLGGSRGRSRLPGATFPCAGGASPRRPGRSATLVALLSPMGLQAGQEHVEGPGAQASTHPSADPGDRPVRGERRARSGPGGWTVPGAGAGASRSVPGSRRRGSAALRAPGPRAGASRYPGCPGPRRSPAPGGTGRASPRALGARHLGSVSRWLRLPVRPTPRRSVRPRRGRAGPRAAPGGTRGPGHRAMIERARSVTYRQFRRETALPWAAEPRRVPMDVLLPG